MKTLLELADLSELQSRRVVCDVQDEPDGRKRFVIETPYYDSGGGGWEKLVDTILDPGEAAWISARLAANEPIRIIQPDAVEVTRFAGGSPIHTIRPQPRLIESVTRYIDQGVESDELRIVAYLRALAQKLRDVPAKYGTDEYDVERVEQLADKLEALG